MIWSLEAEMAVLGAMILDPRTVPLVARSLGSQDFARLAHRAIYRSCLGIGDALDLVTLKEDLASAGKLAACGGEEYLMSLAEFVVSAANVEQYVAIVREKAERRRAIESARELMRLAEGESGIEELRAARSALANDCPAESGIVPFSEIAVDGEDRGVPTFLPELNALTSTGGWPCEQLSVASAYHKGGKSTFMLTDFLHAARLEERVLYATFADLSAQQIKRRLIKAQCGWKKRPAFHEDSQIEFDNSVHNLHTWDVFVYDASALEGSDIESFCAWIRAESRSRPFSRIYVDYAQELTSRAVPNGDEYATAAVCARALAKLARQTGAAIVVGSQITEGVAGTKTKTKGSRRWEEVAGLVLRIEREGEQATISVPFSRFGPCGPGCSVDCHWDPKRLRFAP
ncbi:MAG TPA: DnaB-like helicase N-terminal domain-containing protein [Fimbriimonadaceae bacterium]|nr:DnaB-like helicase N-terminal domain-containing protein [Fimbriimonadaceae bacterium]